MSHPPPFPEFFPSYVWDGRFFHFFFLLFMRYTSFFRFFTSARNSVLFSLGRNSLRIRLVRGFFRSKQIFLRLECSFRVLFSYIPLLQCWLCILLQPWNGAAPTTKRGSSAPRDHEHPLSGLLPVRSFLGVCGFMNTISPRMCHNSPLSYSFFSQSLSSPQFLPTSEIFRGQIAPQMQADLFYPPSTPFRNPLGLLFPSQVKASLIHTPRCQPGSPLWSHG